MTDAIKSFGARWEYRQQDIRKKDAVVDIAQFSLMAAVGFALRINFPKTTILTTVLTPAFAASYLWKQQKLRHPDTFIASAMKASFLLGAFLAGIGAGTAYRGIQTLVNAAKINDIASGLHLITFTAGVTFPLAGALVKLPSQWLKDEERIKSGADYLKEAVEFRLSGSDDPSVNIATPWAALSQMGWFSGLSSLLDKESINDDSISRTTELVTGGVLAYGGLRRLANFQNQRDLEENRRRAPFIALNVMQNSCRTGSFKQKKIINFQSRLAAKLSLEQIKEMVKLCPSIDKNVLIHENADYKAYILSSLDHLSELLKGCADLKSKCEKYEKLSEEELILQKDRVLEDINALEKKMREMTNLLQEKDDLIVDKEGKIEEKELSADTEIRVKLASLLVYRPDIKALEQLKLKVERLQRKENPVLSEQSNPEDDFTECVGTSWKESDYQQLADFFQVALADLDQKLTELGLNTRRELAEKGILLSLEDKDKPPYHPENGNIDDKLVKDEEQKRLHKFIGFDSQLPLQISQKAGNQYLQNITSICSKALLVGCLAANVTVAPGYFAAGVVIALVSRRIAITVNDPERQRYLSAIQLAISMFCQQMIANFDSLSMQRQAQVLSAFTFDNYLVGSTNDYRGCAVIEGYLLTREAERMAKKIYIWATVPRVVAAH
jgi:hypothetical protein